MDITDATPPAAPVELPAAGSSSQSPAEVAPQAETSAAEFPHEVNTLEDLHVTKELVLGPEDCPSELSDDESALLDDSDASSVASSAVNMEDAEQELPPPDEDHSVQQLQAHTGPVFAVAVNAAKPEIVATGGGDDVGYMWRVGQPTPLCKLEGHTDTISALGWGGA